MRLGIAGALLALAVAGLSSAWASRGGTGSSSSATSGDLYFTTFYPPAVERVHYSLVGGTLRMGRPDLVARTGGADGLVFAPDGSLLVGGAGLGTVTDLSIGSGTRVTKSAGSQGAYHLAVSPDGRTLYTAGAPGKLVAMPLDPFGAGRLVQFRGEFPFLTALAFGDGKVLATSSTPAGTGSVFEVDLSAGRAAPIFEGIEGAHGIAYDTFSSSFILVGGDVVLQLSASNPSVIVSERTLPGTQLDQVALDGHGDAFLASNTGTLAVIAYAATGRIGDLGDRTEQAWLARNLDDVAPLSGPGSPPVDHNAAPWLVVGGVAAVLFLVLLSWPMLSAAPGQLARRRRQRQPRRRLPHWDRRRSSRFRKPI